MSLSQKQNKVNCPYRKLSLTPFLPISDTCQCFGTRLLPVFRDMLPVASTSWKASLKEGHLKIKMSIFNVRVKMALIRHTAPISTFPGLNCSLDWQGTWNIQEWLSWDGLP